MKDVIAGLIDFLLEFMRGGLDMGASGGTDTAAGAGTILGLLTTDMNGTVFDFLWKITISIAYGMTAIYFVYECNNKWAFEGNDISAKSFVAPFLKAIVAIVVIGNSEAVFKGMWGVVQDWANAAAGTKLTEVDSSAFKDVTGDTITKGLGILQLVGLLFCALLGYLISLIVNLIYKYKVIMYKIEFEFRAGISPLALADSFNGLSSNSVRWLKGFFGVCLYGAAFILVPKIGAAIAGEVVTDVAKNLFDPSTHGLAADKGPIDFFTACFTFIIIPIAELGVLGAIQQACKEAAS